MKHYIVSLFLIHQGKHEKELVLLKTSVRDQQG